MSERPPDAGSSRRGPLRPRTRAGVALAAVALVALVALVVVLAHAFTSAALALLGTGSAATSGPTPTFTHAAGQSATTSAPAATAGDWTPYVNADYGFRLDLPSALASGHGFFINNASGQGFDMTYNGAPLTSPLQRIEAETTVEVLYSSAVTDRDICPDAGAPVTLGASISGRQQSNAAPLSNGPAAPYPYVHASVVQGGVAIRFELRGQPPSETFMARYSQIWNHMLASFAPVGGAPAFTTHPCG
jgi:hypothetical protein